MKKIFTKEFIIGTLICLATIIEGAVVYDKLPEMMATHFTFSGTPNGYQTKAFSVFFLPLILTALNFLIALSLEYSPKGKNSTKLYKTIHSWLCPVLALVIQTSIILFAFDINIITPALIIVTIYILALIITAIQKQKEEK